MRSALPSATNSEAAAKNGKVYRVSLVAGQTTNNLRCLGRIPERISSTTVSYRDSRRPGSAADSGHLLDASCDPIDIRVKELIWEIPIFW
jgi:hypothetical protein